MRRRYPICEHGRVTSCCRDCLGLRPVAFVPVAPAAKPERVSWPLVQVRMGYVPPAGTLARAILGSDRPR